MKGSEIMKEFEEIMKEAKKLYGDGKWKEARDLLLPLLEEKLYDMEASALRRLLGWCYYYLGKKKKEDPRKSGKSAVSYWDDVITLGISKDDINSALGGLPLAYKYLLEDTPENTQKAIEFAKKRVEEAPDAKTKKVALNSKGCIERDSGFIVEALKSFSEALKLQEPEESIRTTANLLNNKAVTLMKIVPCLTTSKNTVIEETKDFFEQAKKKYRESEKAGGESTKFHLDRIEERLEELEKFKDSWPGL